MPQPRRDAPHIILFPKLPSIEQPSGKGQATVDAHGFCVIVASEGAQTADGRLLSDQGERDAFGHRSARRTSPHATEMIKSELGLKYHWAVADYLQRAARHAASQTDLDQAYAVGQRRWNSLSAGRMQ